MNEKLSSMLERIEEILTYAIIEAKELEAENENLNSQVDALQLALEEAQSND